MTAVWSPHPGSQVQFLTCPVFECLFEGTRGPGKTDALLMSYAQFVGRGFGPAWRGILFRETYKQLGDVVVKSKRWFRQFFPAARFLESTSDYKWVFPGGEELLLRVGIKADDYWDYHGHEYPWIGFEELTNWRTLDFYEMMHSCCRSSQPGMPRMVRSTTNPFGRGHAAVKERFQITTVSPGTIIQDENGRARTYVHGDISENTSLLANDPEYLKTLDGIKDPNRKRAWRFGDWNINIGAFLEHCWKPEKHVVKPFSIPSSWKVWRAMDWGYSHPYSVLWFAMDPDGKRYIWRELYGCAKDDDGKFLPNVGTKESPEALAKRILEREKHDERLGLEMGPSFAGTDIFGATGRQFGVNNTHAETFRREGVQWREAWTAKGSRAAGAMEIIRLLENDLLFVFETCEHWIRTVPTIGPSPDDPDDVDTEAEDHAWDCTRYGLLRKRATPEEPQKQEIVHPETVQTYSAGQGIHRIERTER